MNDDLKYLRDCLEKVELIPYEWDGEDKNIGAFRSKEELVAWYGQGPGVDGEPYRDRGFYCRELAMLSRIIQPDFIVEFGTSLGIGTCLLRWLNPSAQLYTVDVELQTFMPENKIVPMGHLAKHQEIICNYVTTSSSDFRTRRGVDLCFIDADHSYESVVKDSERAWQNRSTGKPWAISWHDYNTRHPGVQRAVLEFCMKKKLTLKIREDSDTVWVCGDK